MRRANRNNPNVEGEAEQIRGEMSKITDSFNNELPTKKGELTQVEDDLSFVSGIVDQQDPRVLAALDGLVDEKHKITKEIKKITDEYENGLSDWRTEVPELKEKALEKLKQDLPNYSELFESGKYLEIRDLSWYLSGQVRELEKHGEKDEYTDQLETNLNELVRLRELAFSTWEVTSIFGKKTGMDFDRFSYLDFDDRDKLERNHREVEIPKMVSHEEFLRLRESGSDNCKKLFDGVISGWEGINKLRNKLSICENNGDTKFSKEIQAEIEQEENKLKILLKELFQVATMSLEWWSERSHNKIIYPNDRKVARLAIGLFITNKFKVGGPDFGSFLQSEFESYGSDLEEDLKVTEDVLREKLALDEELSSIVSPELSLKFDSKMIKNQDPASLLDFLGSRSGDNYSGESGPTRLEQESQNLERAISYLNYQLSDYNKMLDEKNRLMKETGGALGGLFKGKEKNSLLMFIKDALKKIGSPVPSSDKECQEVFDRVLKEKMLEVKEQLERFFALRKKYKDWQDILTAPLANDSYKKYKTSSNDLKGYQDFVRSMDPNDWKGYQDFIRWLDSRNSHG